MKLPSYRERARLFDLLLAAHREFNTCARVIADRTRGSVLSALWITIEDNLLVRFRGDRRWIVSSGIVSDREIEIMKGYGRYRENLTRKSRKKSPWSRPDWDERERGELTNRWRGKLDYTSPRREKDVSRLVDVSHFVLRRHDRHILENTCCYAGYEVTIAGSSSSWNRFYCTPTRLKRGIRNRVLHSDFIRTTSK